MTKTLCLLCKRYCYLNTCSQVSNRLYIWGSGVSCPWKNQHLLAQHNQYIWVFHMQYIPWNMHTVWFSFLSSGDIGYFLLYSEKFIFYWLWSSPFPVKQSKMIWMKPGGYKLEQKIIHERCAYFLGSTVRSMKSRAPFQYLTKRLIARPRRVSRPRDLHS